ncbi:MAG: GTP-binding protein [Candidatus Heimdallarchaeota archaeon]
MDSIRSGKTSLIVEIVKRLKIGYKLAIIKRDLTTTIDSDSIVERGVEVIRVSTGKMSHLYANIVRKALLHFNHDSIDKLLKRRYISSFVPQGSI